MNKVLFEFETDEDKFADIFPKYKVFEEERAICGLYILAFRENGESVSPFNERPVIRALINEVERLKGICKTAGINLDLPIPPFPNLELARWKEWLSSQVEGVDDNSELSHDFVEILKAKLGDSK